MAIRLPALFFLPNTTTLLAQGAMKLLASATQPLLDEAIFTLQNRNLAASVVMRHLEQHVNFAEVLQQLSKDWSSATQKAFAAAFSMELEKTEVMDLIVAIAILNEDDLEAELRSENTSPATVGDLLENRRITWQYPPPGTLLEPPYLVFVAVEHLDNSQADAEIKAILSNLVDYKGYKIPQRTSGPIKPFPMPGLRIDPDIVASVGWPNPILGKQVFKQVGQETVNPSVTSTTAVVSDLTASANKTEFGSRLGLSTKLADFSKGRF